ncbi:Crp/Fnr family transcriptional regulator [Arcobacteraceae bacterium]|nr:Crp/Fnr family transcriptional regulator [Arcobacteraceae bacterium]
MEGFQFFEKITNEEKKYLLDNSKEIVLPKDYTLFYQGDICNEILLLQEGKVKLSIHGELDEVISLYEIGTGEQCIINTSSTISNTPAIATAHTLSAIKGRLVPSKVIKELMNKSTPYQQYVFSFFALKFHTLTTLIEDIKFKKLDSRILGYLKNKDKQTIEITHEELAYDLGTSRVVVSRILKDLENKDFIKLHRGKIEVL